MSVKMIIDSTAGYSQQELEQLDLTAVPLHITIDGREYQDGIDLTPREFYQKLERAKSLPVTGAVEALVFEQLFSLRLEEADEVVAIFHSSRFSDTCQEALKARSRLVGPERIHIIDAGSVSLGSMVLINEAIRMRHLGASGGEIAARLEELKQRLRVLVAVGSLEYLRRSGKLSAGGGLLRKLLSLRPVVSLTQGNLALESQSRGDAAACQWIAQQLVQEGFDPVCPPVLGSAQAPQLAAQLEQCLEETAGITGCGHCEIGPVMGAYVGPGSAGIAWIAAQPKA